MNYLSSDKPHPRGELCYRGPVGCKGYFKNDEKTAELIDKNGWYHSGDVASIDEIGRIKIVDRSKNIFKLSQGEYIAPEKIENIYVQSQWVAQCFVYGDSFKSSLVCIVVPDFEVLTPWAKQKNHPKADSQADLCKDPEIVKMVLEDMTKKGKDNKMLGFEFVQSITLVPEPFTVENELLTPTFKLKRPQAKKAFQGPIDEMYKGKD